MNAYALKWVFISNWHERSLLKHECSLVVNEVKLVERRGLKSNREKTLGDFFSYTQISVDKMSW